MIILTVRTDQPQAELGLLYVGQASDLDGVQGDAENRTEAYALYVEGESEAVTPQSVKNNSGVHSSAVKQAVVVRELAKEKWKAHRELAETIHHKLDELLNKSSNSLKDIEGIVVFEGPGSFTGLRIGLSMANALAYSLKAPIAATGQEDWIEQGVKQLLAGEDNKIALPKYGAPPRVTQPKK